MLKIFVVVIGIIAIVSFIFSICNSWSIDELKRQVNSLDILTFKKFDPYSKEWNETTRDLRHLKLALREQGIATDYISENKLDFTECKKTDEEYKKEAEALVSSVKNNNEDFTIFEEIEVGPLKDSRKKKFRCSNCSMIYPIDITLQCNAKYCSYCGRKIAHFQFLDIRKD